MLSSIELLSFFSPGLGATFVTTILIHNLNTSEQVFGGLDSYVEWWGIIWNTVQQEGYDYYLIPWFRFRLFFLLPETILICKDFFPSCSCAHWIIWTSNSVPDSTVLLGTQLLVKHAIKLPSSVVLQSSTEDKNLVFSLSFDTRAFAKPVCPGKYS